MHAAILAVVPKREDLGKSEPVSLRVPAKLLVQIDAIARDRNQSRTQTILFLVKEGLRHEQLPDGEDDSSVEQ